MCDDVVIIGAGSAGLTAALAARDALREDSNSSILVLDKQPRIGGNSMKASSGINGLESDGEDSYDAFAGDTLNSGGGKSNETLVQVLVNESGDALKFLRKVGVDFADSLVQLGGHGVPRTHTVNHGNVGAAIVKTLESKVRERQGIDIRTNARVVKLLGKVGDRVRGVVYEDETGRQKTVVAKSVVIATGGFGANRDWLRKYVPYLEPLSTTNGDFAQGDGLVLGKDMGAEAIDLEYVQVHPTGFVDPHAPDSQTKVCCSSNSIHCVMMTIMTTTMMIQLCVCIFI